MSNRANRAKPEPSERESQLPESDTWSLPRNEQAASGPRQFAHYPARPAPRKTASRDQSEQRAWASFYRHIGDPLVAAEVIRTLDDAGEIRAERLALYLQAKRSLRLHKQRQLQAARIAGALRLLGRAVFVLPVTVPAKLLWRALQFMGNVLLACMPEHAAEPGEQRLRDLRKPSASVGTTDFGPD